MPISQQLAEHLPEQPIIAEHESVADDIVAFGQRLAPLDSGKHLPIIASEVDGRVVAVPAAPQQTERELSRSPESQGWALLNRAERPEEVQKVARMLAELQLVKESLRQARGTAGRDYSVELQRHEAELYDHYDGELFQVALGFKRREIERLDVSAVPEAAQAKALLLGRLEELVDPDVPTDAIIETCKPAPETISAVKAWLEDQFGDMLTAVDDMAAARGLQPDDKFNHEAIAAAFTMAIDSTPHLHDNGWRVAVVEQAKTAISVRNAEHEIVVPVGRQVTPVQLKKLLIHEVFGHALRSAEAEQLGDTVGQFGTATYLRFEESLEVVLEQCLEGKYDEKRGVDYYVSIGMALGSDKHAPLDKDEIYSMFKTMAQLKAIDKYRRPLTDKEVADSTKSALTHYRRVFAGMANTQDGTAHLKDINYFAGRMDAWRLLTAIARADQVDEGMRWLLASKMNPMDDGDRQIAGAPPMPSSIRELLAKDAEARIKAAAKPIKR